MFCSECHHKCSSLIRQSSDDTFTQGVELVPKLTIFRGPIILVIVRGPQSHNKIDLDCEVTVGNTVSTR